MMCEVKTCRSDENFLILVVLFLVGVLRYDVFFARLLVISTKSLLHSGKLLLFAFLLGISDLLETREVLTSFFVELVFDVGDRIVNSRDEYELQGVNASVGDLQRTVNGHELGLQGGNSNQDL